MIAPGPAEINFGEISESMRKRSSAALCSLVRPVASQRAFASATTTRSCSSLSGANDFVVDAVLKLFCGTGAGAVDAVVARSSVKRSGAGAVQAAPPAKLLPLMVAVVCPALLFLPCK